MRQHIHKAVGVKLAEDLFIGTTEAGALRTAALHHEAFHDPVEGQAVIEAALGQLHEIGAGDGRVILLQQDGDLTVIFDLDIGIVLKIRIQLHFLIGRLGGRRSSGILLAGRSRSCECVIAAAERQQHDKNQHHREYVSENFHGIISFPCFQYYIKSPKQHM